MEVEEKYEDVVAFALIKTKPGAAADVAKEASTFRWGEDDEIRGVRWAAVVTDLFKVMKEPYDVMAVIRVGDKDALGELREQIRKIEGVVNPLVIGVEELYKNGELLASFGHNGFP